MKKYKYILSLLTIFLVVFRFESHGEGSKIVYNADQVRKADELFKAKNYQEALPLYSRLLSVNPDKTQFMYRFGACLLMAGKEKSNAATFLFLASKDSLTPVDVFYFLGKSYLINNDFVKAQAAFAIYKEKAKVTDIKKYDIENYFRNCENGIKLSSKRKNVIIVNSSQIPFDNFYKKFDYEGSSGRVVKASDEFLSSLDRARQKDPVMYVSNDRTTVYLPSYGKKGDKGKDIYVAHKKADNTWSLPESLGATVNSSADEDFPFMDPDGRTLYFSSNGHNSIGGYDLFKTVYNPDNKLWSDPENLGIPINTSGDDFLFVPGADETAASYSTTEETEKNSISLRKIKMPGGRSETVIISGVFLPLDQKIRRDARITVLTDAGDGIVTSVHTDPNTGFYNLSIPAGEKYMILVEGGGYIPHAEFFDVPSEITSTNFKQVIRIDKQDQLEKLTLQNYFSSGIAASVPTNTFTHAYSTQLDSSSLKSFNIDGNVVFATLPTEEEGNSNLAINKDNSDSSIAVIEQNKKENKKNTLPTVKIKRQDKYDPTLDTGPSSAVLHQQEEESSRKEEIKEEESVPELVFSENVSNKELAEMVYVDAQVMQNEADSLYRESGIIKKLASEKEELASSFKSQAEEKNIDSENAKALMELANTNKSEASELYAEADRLRFLAASKEAEADNTIDEANEIYEIGEMSELFASKNGKIGTQLKLDKSESENPESEQNIIQTGSPLPSNNSDKTKSSDEMADSNQQVKNIYTDKTINLSKPASKELSPNTNSSVAVKANDNGPTQNSNRGALNTPEESVDKSNSTVASKDIKADKVSGSQIQDHQSQSTDKIPQVTGISKESTSVNSKSPANKIDTSNIGIAKAVSPDKTEITQKVPATANAPKSNDNKEVVTLNIPTKHVGMGNSGNKNTEESSAIEHGYLDAEKVRSEKNSNAIVKTDPVISASAGTLEKNVTSKSENVKDTNNELNNQSATNSQTTLRNEKENSTNSEVASVVVKNNPSVGEAPRPDVTTYGPGNSTGNELKQPVNEEALTAYRSYQNAMNKSNQLTAQSLQIQSQLERSPFSPQRDSLVRVSNEMSLQSIHEWQAAQQQIKKARSIEPGIEYKMSVNDFTASTQKSSGGSMMQSTASNSSSRVNSTATNKIDANPNPATNNSINKNDASAKISSPAGNSGEQLVNNSTDNEVANKSVNGNSTAMVSGKQTTNPAGETENLDKNNPEYPTYVKLKEEINNKQGQTISDFATALNLNKKSIEEKELENNLRDKAQLEKNEAKKKELLRQAEEYKIKSEKHEKESVAKFSSTQEKISNVKALNSDLAMVKERISTNTKSTQFAESTGTQANFASPVSSESRPIERSAPTDELVTNSPEKVVSKTTPTATQKAQPAVILAKNEKTLPGTIENVTGKDNYKTNNSSISSTENKITDKKLVVTNVPNVSAKMETENLTANSESRDAPTNNSGSIKETAMAESKKISEVNKSEDATTKSLTKITATNPTTDRTSLNNSNTSNTGQSAPERLSKDSIGKNTSTSAIQKSSNQQTAIVVKDSKPKSPSITGNSQEKKNSSMSSNDYKSENQKIVSDKIAGKTDKVTKQKGLQSGSKSPYSDLNVSEEEIVTASVSKKESAEVLKNLFSINGVSADSKVSDIPMDPQLPDGLVFKVQISAFRKPIEADNFNGIQPLTGESTRPGWIRYCVGMFKTFEPANIVKKEIRKIGYKDAFVVAYYNGKRIELFEAYQMIKDKENLSAYKSQAAKEIAILGSANIKRDKTPLTDDADELAFYGKQPLTKQSTGVAPASTINTKEENIPTFQLNDGEYAIQVGVYHKSKAPQNLASVNDLRSEQINNNLYRFTSGKFTDYKSAEKARDGIREQGVKDAFIVLYKNGKSVVASEKTTDLKHEANAVSLSAAKTIQIKPAVPSKEVVYKVQIGAYKKDVPFNMIEAYIAINDEGITTQLDDRDLHLFFAGDFTDYKRAEELRLEIINKGVKDAFVVALQNGKRVLITEEIKK